jgi:hypothetical protein
MDYLRSYAEKSGVGKGFAAENSIAEEEEDDQIPALVENFEEAAAK